jgi:hypothetical protein
MLLVGMARALRYSRGVFHAPNILGNIGDMCRPPHPVGRVIKSYLPRCVSMRRHR